MNILVTGYKGFIGSAMFKALKQQGMNVIGCQCETFSPKLLEGMDWVVHCGAITSTVCQDKDAIYRQNILFTEMLVKYCVHLNIGIQFSSSASVYGSKNTTFKETDDLNPESPYAESKVEGEKILGQYKDTIPVQIFRYFNVYGHPDEGSKKHPSPYTTFRMQAKRDGVIKVFEGSESFRKDFIYVNNVVQTQKKFLNHKKSLVVNLGTGYAVSIMDIAKQISNETGAVIEIVPFPDSMRKCFQKYTCADTTNLKKELELISHAH